MTSGAEQVPREERERRFWDEHVDALDDCLDGYRRGPDPNTRALIEALEPLDGMRVLDLGCGAGLLSAWLAERGANVTALDVSADSVTRAAELFEALSLEVETLHGAFPSQVLAGRKFDRVSGRYVLHHLDLTVAAPALAGLLEPGGRGAFVETMQTNPLLGIARRRLVGKLGVPRYGTLDESPLSRDDLERLEREVGPVSVEVAELTFFRLLDRQLLGFRYGAVSKVLSRLDDALLALGLKAASYHQVLVLERTRGT